jgi:alkane 1-monooxygenase
VTSATAVAEESAVSVREVAWIWIRHLTSLVFPALSLTFLWTGPHTWYVAALFMLPMTLLLLLDARPIVERRQPAKVIPGWPFDALVYVLAALQFLIVFETVRLFANASIFSADMLMVFLLVGASSGFSIITAHELIHRPNRWQQRLGRLLLCTVLYEHFYTEHLRGHHVRVGTPEDPATARFGEAYEPFFRRTVPAQFRSAWRLETQRLGDPDMRLWDRRILGSRVLHGLVVEWVLVVAVLVAFGPVALVAFLLQAFSAVRLLEAVNYFEHWGLRRRQARVAPVDSWDTHAWFTYYGLVGLSRHADHHAWPARPYQSLRVFDEAPVLPMGYVGTIDQVMGQNAEFQRLASEELARRGLGPFSEDGPVGEEQAHARLARAQAAERPARRSRLGRRWLALPIAARIVSVLAGVVLATAAGVQWETGGLAMGFGARVLLHAWIFGAIVAAIIVRRRIDPEMPGRPLSWFAAFAVLALLGVLGDALLA